MSGPIVVGLTGYAQHGKDTVGNRLVSDWGFERFAFADPLKSMALTLNPHVSLITEKLDVEFMRHFTASELDGIDFVRLEWLVSTVGWEVAKKADDVRRFLQVLGTEAVRGHLGDDSWVHACGKAILESGCERAVITDARFPNEFRFVQRELRGKLIRVTRLNADGTPFDNGVGQTHPSELHVASAPADYNIVSISGDMADLLAKVDAVAAEVEGR